MNYKTYKNNMSVQQKQKKKKATFLHNTHFGINITRI